MKSFVSSYLGQSAILGIGLALVCIAVQASVPVFYGIAYGGLTVYLWLVDGPMPRTLERRVPDWLRLRR